MTTRINGASNWFRTKTTILTILLFSNCIGNAQDPGNKPDMRKDTIIANRVVTDLAVASLNPPEYFGKEQTLKFAPGTHPGCE
jgi:hypothetical protein